MAEYKEKLTSINTFIFDFDGVLSDGKVWVGANGDQIRNTNVKDGYAIQYALKQGYNVCVISGGYSEGMRKRYDMFEGMDVFLKISDKVATYKQYIESKKVASYQVLFMGDDIPDYEVMKLVGVKACPNDAAIEIQKIADYISIFKGGDGCVRDVIEHTLRLHGKWFLNGAEIW
ncbi:MAG: HAD hydrolase family protein [Bacteroidales bacterium]|jgi:3-deoxy-D-manno-octulosonate 8-phosphate phosphatase (KDO 8-P phosphatase)|nr:HAD hydrolase family protein [Bacteroidales bacterium]MDD2687664.1 HAD hydrolase family protein [Bacteroidales bacterium]MDD3330624.1 HAD hydrolase family protein [Bacteroidales bacterium]MDD3691471.1 HAD hydrolase family protein [Bacteroidales bacterium]MDD4044593.1 HAD hydrolase family protein [Bacteroidales bacterium]